MRMRRGQARLVELVAQLRQPVAIPSEHPGKPQEAICEFAHEELSPPWSGEALYRRWRHHASGALAAHEPCV